MDSSEGNKGQESPGGGSLIPSPQKAIEKAKRRFGSGGRGAPPRRPDGSSDDEEEHMLRMSFLEHLEELRTRLIRALIGVGVAFGVSLTFSNQLWDFVRQPALQALTTLHINPPDLVQISPMEGFTIIWFKLPVVCSIFLSFPWLLYQVWAFVSPGLYKKERRFAVPFILTSAGLFLSGGFFAYFVIFRYGLTFLLGIGLTEGVRPMVSITEYFDLFVNVMLGVSVVFELPIIIFFLTLLRIVTPGFLIRHSRYAILIIFIIAAVVTPTPDVFNMMLFALPMCLLFYVGIFAGYLLILRREGRKFPWQKVFMIGSVVLIVLGIFLYLAMTKYGIRLVPHWPFFMR
ncbi:MAG: twin-arginine translocase subunit TatC [Bryobacteraceae bacterium]|jgi:sec-independent protein translocase protein TatC